MISVCHDHIAQRTYVIDLKARLQWSWSWYKLGGRPI